MLSLRITVATLFRMISRIRSCRSCTRDPEFTRISSYRVHIGDVFGTICHHRKLLPSCDSVSSGYMHTRGNLHSIPIFHAVSSRRDLGRTWLISTETWRMRSRSLLVALQRIWPRI